MKLEVEKRRKDYERDPKDPSPLTLSDIMKDGGLASPLSLEGYIKKRLGFIDRKEDSNLYYIMRELMRNWWYPTDEQSVLEENMISDIEREYKLYFGIQYNCEERYSVGDVLLYFAQRLGYNADCSVASALEMLLVNGGLLDKEGHIYDGYVMDIQCREWSVKFCRTDYRIEGINIFKTGDTEDENDEKVRSWWDQFNDYLVWVLCIE